MKERDKFIVLRALKSASEDIKSMTVRELIDKLSKTHQEEKEKEEKENERICKEFRGSYLKFKIVDGTFGDETKYIYIEDIKPGSMTADYERLFDIKGQRINFSDVITSHVEMKMGDTRDSMLGEALERGEKISKEDFEQAKKECEKIRGLIDKMKQ